MKSTTKLPQRNSITTPRVVKKLGSVVGGDKGDANAYQGDGGANIAPNTNNKFQAPKQAPAEATGQGVGLADQIKQMQKNKKPGAYVA